jgi:hypothetical protein
LKSYYGTTKEKLGLSDRTDNLSYPPMDAQMFKSMICNRSIEGAYRNITLNHICDRIDIGYAVYDLDPDSGELEVSIDLTATDS